MKGIKILLGSLGLPILSFLAKVILLLVLYAGVWADKERWLMLFIGLICGLSYLYGIAYIYLLDWVCKSRFAAIFSAIIVCLLNLYHFLVLLPLLKEEPVSTILNMLLNLSQIVFVFWACRYSFTERYE